MRFEEYVQQNAMKDASKKRGIDKTFEFLARITGKEEEVANEELYIEYLRGTTEDDFRKNLTRLNGLLQEIKPPQRALLQSESAITEGGYDDLVALRPPSIEAREEILSSTFKKIQELLASKKLPKDEEARRVAITFFNTIIYLHPFADANGRLARLLYFLTSPDVDKKSSNPKERITDVLFKRSKEVDEYHWGINAGWFQQQLENRGILELDEEGHFFSTYEVEESWGFDVEMVRFIAAYDVMSPEEREQYGHKSPSGKSLKFIAKELPKELKVKIKGEMERVRKDFTESTINLSLSEEQEFPQWALDTLNKSFEELNPVGSQPK